MDENNNTLDQQTQNTPNEPGTGSVLTESATVINETSARPQQASSENSEFQAQQNIQTQIEGNTDSQANMRQTVQPGQIPSVPNPYYNNPGQSTQNNTAYGQQQNNTAYGQQQNSAAHDGYQSNPYGNFNGYSYEQPPKKDNSKGKSVAITLAGFILCGAAFGFSLGYGLKGGRTSENAVPNFNFEKTSENTDNNTPVINTQTDLVTKQSEIAKVIENTQNSVVNINIKQTTQGFFNQVYEAEGAGSGIIYKEDDNKVYIITNNHVVDGASSCTISLDGETQVEANLIGKDASSDIAVISVAKDKLKEAGVEYKVATFTDSDKVQMGETVIAMGNALGQGKTATVGIVSTTNKEVDIDGTQYNAIQTDAAINPGNSGGALVNTEGEIIGVNSAKLASTTIEGIGYAIPSNTATKIADELIENGTVEHAYLGVSTYTINEQFKQLYHIDTDGVFVTQVSEGTPAEEYGVMPYDIITAVDGKTITKAEELSEIIKTHKPGDKITLSIIRNGESTEVTVTLTNLNQGF